MGLKNTMKAILSTAIALALTIAIAKATPEPEAKLELLKVTGIEGEKSVARTWSASTARLKAASTWKHENESPALTISDAVGIARKHLQAAGQNPKLPLQSVSLKKPTRHEESGMYFFFVISFNDWDEKHPSPLGVTVVVLLDGSVVTPDEPPK